MKEHLTMVHPDVRHLALLLPVVLAAGTASAADVTLRGRSLLVRDTKLARVVGQSAQAMTALPVPAPGGPADPTANPSSLVLDDFGSDGTLVETDLDTSLWRGLGNPPGSKGWIYSNPAAGAGPDPVRRIVLKSKAVKIIARDDGSLNGPVLGAVGVFLSLGGDTWCARFGGTTAKNQAGLVRRKNATPPPDCAVPAPPVCGNGVAEAPEECDDGGTAPGDGCDADCQLEPVNPAFCAGVPATAGTAIDTELVASGLSRPTHVTAPRLDPNRLFIVEQPGRVRIVENGMLLPTPFLDLSDDDPDTVSCCGEQGLFAIAFHPDYESNGVFFASYTAPASGPQNCTDRGAGDNVLARFTVSGDPNVANEASKMELLRVPQPFTNHNGGQIAFGPDGFLYMSIGDGGGGGDPCEAAQDDTTALGKILRVDPDAMSPVPPASVIWAKGLRNPFRFSFDRLTGDLYVGDVGQNAWEEIDFVAAPVPAGLDFQWDDREGRHCFEPMLGCLDDGTPPVLEYCNFGNPDPMSCPAHQSGCSTTGGFAYRGCALPDLQGRYFYSDFCSAFIRSFDGVAGGDAQDLADHTADADPPGGLAIGSVSSFGEDARGELYIVDLGTGPSDGEVYRIVPGS